MMSALPAEPTPVFALEIELSDVMLSVPRLNCTEPAAADVKDAAEAAPPFCSDKELALTTTSPPTPLLPTPATAKIPVENRSEERRVGKDERARTSTYPSINRQKMVEEIQ